MGTNLCFLTYVDKKSKKESHLGAIIHTVYKHADTYDVQLDYAFLNPEQTCLKEQEESGFHYDFYSHLKNWMEEWLKKELLNKEKEENEYRIYHDLFLPYALEEFKGMQMQQLGEVYYIPNEIVKPTISKDATLEEQVLEHAKAINFVGMKITKQINDNAEFKKKYVKAHFFH